MVRFVSQKQIKMSTTTLSNNITANYIGNPASESIFSKFAGWCTAQNENRLLWLAIGIAGHGCILTPVTLMPVVMAGANLTLFILAIAAMGIVLVTNLAALPTKITIPVFFLSIAIDIAVVCFAFASGINAANMF